MESQNEQESFNNGTVEQQKTVNLNLIKNLDHVQHAYGVLSKI